MSGREGAAPKSLPSVQSPEARTNKEDIKNLQPREGRKWPPFGRPQSLRSKVSGDAQWRLDKACPIVTPSMPTFPSPASPNHLSAPESKCRKGPQQRGRQERGLKGQSQATRENRSNPRGPGVRTGQGLCRDGLSPMVGSQE